MVYCSMLKIYYITVYYDEPARSWNKQTIEVTISTIITIITIIKIITIITIITITIERDKQINKNTSQEINHELKELTTISLKMH